MKITETQPLEHATPVVPETEGAIEPEKGNPAGRAPKQSRPTHRRPPDRLAPAENPRPTAEEVSAETYPEAPTGSAGHP